MKDKKWKCEVTGKPIHISECYECHTRSCQVNTGFSDGPELLKDEERSEENVEK